MGIGRISNSPKGTQLVLRINLGFKQRSLMQRTVPFILRHTWVRSHDTSCPLAESISFLARATAPLLCYLLLMDTLPKTASEDPLWHSKLSSWGGETSYPMSHHQQWNPTESEITHHSISIRSFLCVKSVPIYILLLFGEAEYWSIILTATSWKKQAFHLALKTMLYNFQKTA